MRCGNGRDALKFVSHADEERLTHSAATFERQFSIVIAAAEPQAPSKRIEGEKGQQDEVKPTRIDASRRRVTRFMDTEAVLASFRRMRNANELHSSLLRIHNNRREQVASGSTRNCRGNRSVDFTIECGVKTDSKAGL